MGLFLLQVFLTALHFVLEFTKHNNRLVLVYAIILPSISCPVKYIITLKNLVIELFNELINF